MITEPLHFVNDVEAAVHDEGIHPPGFGAEASNTIPALLGGAEFEFKQRIVFRAHDAKIIRHDGGFRTCKSSIFSAGMMTESIHDRAKTLENRTSTVHLWTF